MSLSSTCNLTILPDILSSLKVEGLNQQSIIKADFYVIRVFFLESFIRQSRIRKIKADHGVVAFEGVLKLEKAQKRRGGSGQVEWALNTSDGVGGGPRSLACQQRCDKCTRI